jgi:peroxiredoxin
MSLTHVLFRIVLPWIVLAVGAAAQVPRKSPDLPIKTPSGQDILLSHYRGKVVLVEFLLTTCPTCQRTSQLMNKLYAEYGPRGFQPLGVAIDDRAASLVGAYVQKFGLQYPVGFVLREQALDYLQHSVVQRFSVPRLVLIDRSGTIRQQPGGDPAFYANEEQLLRTWIEELLTEQANATGRKGR